MEEINVSLDPDYDKKETGDLTSLVGHVISRWQGKCLTIQKLSGGFVNTILKVSPDDSTDEDDAFIVRIFTSKSSMVRKDMRSVVEIIRVVGEQGGGAKVLGVFNNGLIYQYTTGEMLNPDIYRHDKHLQMLIGEEIARLHSVKLTDELVEKFWISNGERSPRFQGYNFFLESMPADFTEFNNELSTPAFTRTEFETEYAFVKSLYSDDGNDKLVLCHKDIWWANMLYNKSKDCVHLIDFDLSCCGYPEIDLAHYFVAGQLEYIPGVVLRQHVLRESEKKVFIQHYLEKRREIEGDNRPVTSADVEELLHKTKRAELSSILEKVLPLLHVSKYDPPGQDMVRCSNATWREYLNLKQQQALEQQKLVQ